MTYPAIHSIGTAVPPHKIAQEAHYDILASANGLNRAEKLLLKTIYAKSGIQYRHSVLAEFGLEDQPEHIIWHPAGHQPSTPIARRMEVYEQYAVGLCGEAVQKCLADLPSVKAADITHVITFSCTGMYAPGLDIELVEKFGLQRNAERTCINFMGCYAAINALKNAYHISRSEPDAVVLICGVELCSLHYQKSNEPNQVVANALFSDGAAAAIISSKDLNADGNHPSFCLKSFYSEFEPNAASDMVWRIGNAGFDLRLTPEVPAVVSTNIRMLVDKALQRTGLTQDQIDHYAIHPGGVKILEACETALGISREDNAASYAVLREYGNMSSVTVLFVLRSYMESLSRAEKGQHIFACAFGPGITMESMIVSTC
jgi:predicted naringenin-chalcone synthase